MSEYITAKDEKGEDWVIEFPKRIQDAPRPVQQEYIKLAVANKDNWFYKGQRKQDTQHLIDEAWNTQFKGLTPAKKGVLDQIEEGLQSL